MFFKNILTFLRAGIPAYTDIFSSSLTIQSIDYQGIITTVNRHDLRVGDYVIVKNVAYIWNINNMLYNPSNGILTGFLEDSHQVFKNDKTLNIVGDFEGESKLLSLDLDNKITLCLPKNLTINSLSVSKILNQNINNYFRVEEVINEKSFKINYQESTYQQLSGGQVVTESRVDGGYNVEDYIESYAKLDKRNVDFLYLEYINNEISRSDSSTTDFNNSMQKHTEQWITNRDNIAIYYISNTTHESSKSLFVDRATRLVRDSLLKVLQKNAEIDEDNGFTLTYDGGSVQEIKAGQTNFSTYQYIFYLQFTFSDNMCYNNYLIKRIKDINLDCNFNTKNKDCQ